MNNFFDNQRLLELIWKRKIHFVIIGIIAIVLSAIFSGPAFITPKFKSTARVYPSNVWSMSDESETEQMIEVLNSNDIKFKMFDVFRLDTVYKIHKDDPLYFTYMLDLYNTNVGVSKTEFETAEVKVLDKNPQRASDMCDSIVVFYNRKVRNMHKLKDLEMVDNANRLLDWKHEDLEEIKIKLDSIRNDNGIIDFKTQVPEVTRGYMTALATGRGNTADAKKIEKLYDNFSESGTESEILNWQFEQTLTMIDSFQNVHDHYLGESKKDITYSHLVQKPFPADKKSYPVRWLIVMLSTLSALFLSLLVFLVLDYQKQ